jgi:hypothetical protein
VHLGLAQSDDTTLAAVPSNFSGMAAMVLDTGNTLGGQHQHMFDELARELTQKVIDGQLGLSNHGQQWQCRLGVAGEQGVFYQLVGIEFTGDMEFGFRLCHGG